MVLLSRLLRETALQKLKHKDPREDGGQLSRGASWQHSGSLLASCSQQNTRSERRVGAANPRGLRMEPALVPTSQRQLSRKGKGNFSRPVVHTPLNVEVPSDDTEVYKPSVALWAGAA